MVDIELILVAHTALFMSSKNQEVEPMSIKDLTEHLLKDYHFENKTNRVVLKEMRIRNAINHENEVSTLFDFLLYYVKIWKLKTQHFIQRIGG